MTNVAIRVRSLGCSSRAAQDEVPGAGWSFPEMRKLEQHLVFIGFVDGVSRIAVVPEDTPEQLPYRIESSWSLLHMAEQSGLPLNHLCLDSTQDF